jgi:D-alanyl-lipoteichoic acid acyltransferase DltB (MBOAT superfamily)
VNVAAATLLFCMQVDCDFSGYSDIARGRAPILDPDRAAREVLAAILSAL